MTLPEVFDVNNDGAGVFTGRGPTYPWGGLYGGQIVAQALLAAGQTALEGMAVHSLRAYFIRRGDQNDSVRYEVENVRDGRSFCTRRVIARQAVGVILNLEASFQRLEETADVDLIELPADAAPPSSLKEESWSPLFRRAFLPREQGRSKPGRSAAWMRMADELPNDPLVHSAALAYLSDDLPTEAVLRGHPLADLTEEQMWESFFSASLDHTIWFHRPAPADEWQLHDFTCHTFVGGRGLAIGHVHTESGIHVATVAQETLLRDLRTG